MCEARAAEGPDEVRILGSLNLSQQRVFSLAVAGMRNKEIASRMGITVQTVKNRMRAIYDATGMGCGRELLAFAYTRPMLIAALQRVDAREH